MTPRPGMLSFLLILIVTHAALSAGCTAPSTQPQQAATSPPAATGSGNTIVIQNFAFSPATLTVPSGTTVTWTNNDSPTHTITSDAGDPVDFSSGSLAPGASYQFTFTTPGTYAYHCSIHPSMKGTVVVT